MDDPIYDDESGESEDTSDSDERLEDEGQRPLKLVLDDDEFQFQMLTTDQVLTYMLECIRETQSIIGLSPTTTRLLLSHCKWDREKLLERFTLSDVERDKLFMEAHVVNPFRPAASSKSGVSNNVSSSIPRHTRSSLRQGISSTSGSRTAPVNVNFGMDAGGAYSQSYSPSSSGTISTMSVLPNPVETYCEICCSQVPNGNMAGLGCLHRFCEKCWTEYLTTKIMDEGASHTISCPAHGCDILVDDSLVIRLIEKPNVRQKYERLITNSFVACHRLLRWCPTPDCGHAARARAATDRRPHLVVCACGNMFCFVCGESWHDPVSCEHLRKWIRKCDDDSETSNWIAANTKECPKCRVTIEKDGGCNHMICKNLSCRNEFCWVCLGPWEPHGSSWYNCNRFDEEEAKKARDSQQRSRSALERYLFYCNRYMNHLQSLKFEHKLFASVKAKMDTMQAQNTSSWIEVQFLKTAVDTLCTCRRTLMYTYVFAFYLKRNNHSQIFEENQKDLENATEKLSEFLERDITADNIIEMKQRVQDQYRYCEDRRKKLLKHVHEGVDAEIWEYIEPAN